MIDAVRHSGEQERLDGVDVTRDARQYVPEPPPLEEPERELLDMPEHVGAQRQQEAFADPRGRHVVGEPQDAGGDDQPQVGRCDPEERS